MIKRRKTKKSIYSQFKLPEFEIEDETSEDGIKELINKLENNAEVDNVEILRNLKKILISLNNLKLQNSILKFNSIENEKRFENENYLLKKQIDLLTKTKLKLVEKKEIKDTKYNDHVKVFHLEKI